MDLSFSPEHLAFREEVRAFLRTGLPLHLREKAAVDGNFDHHEIMEWHRVLFERGWVAPHWPAEHGGPGLDVTRRFILTEELELSGAPTLSVFGLSMVGPLLIQFGTPAQQQRFLPKIIAGDEVWCQGYSEPNAGSDLALAHAELRSRFDVSDVETRAVKSGDGYRLDGSKRWVLNGHAADTIVVSARTSEGEIGGDISVFVLDRDTPGLTIQPVKTMDGHHAAMITFTSAQVGKDRLLGAEGSAVAALEEAMDIGAAAACAEGAGIARAVLEMTTDYLRTREQFGVKIGSFQALQHRAVDMFVEVELCKSTAIMAAIKVSDPDVVERKSAVSAAKVQLAVGGRFVTQQAVQLHGGIGVTDEHDVGLYFKRMHVLNTIFGDEEHHVHRYSHLPSFTAGLSP